MKRAFYLLSLSALIFYGTVMAETPPKPVELTGTIKSGMMAIGGETTGTLLVTEQGESYELVMEPEMLHELAGKKAKVSGTLLEKQGVEVPVRRIVTVTSAEPAN